MNHKSEATPAPLAESSNHFLALARKATRGPWGWGNQKRSEYDELMQGSFLYAHRSVDEDEVEANGEFIEEARRFADYTLPSLLARLAAAEAQVAKVYEVIDKEFDTHHRDSKSNCTPQQAQFYTNCEGAIAMLRMHLEAVVPEPKKP